jgi:hypothetical protein
MAKIKKVARTNVGMYFKFIFLVPIILISLHALSLAHSIFLQGGVKYIYTPNPDAAMEEIRQKVLKELTPIDRLFIVYYEPAYTDHLSAYRNAEAKGDTDLMERFKEDIDKAGICELNNKQISPYIYVRTYTTLHWPYKKFTFDCNSADIFFFGGD